jgi:hypothetical protein
MLSSDKNQNYTRKAMTELNDREVRQFENILRNKGRNYQNERKISERR